MMFCQAKCIEVKLTTSSGLDLLTTAIAGDERLIGVSDGEKVSIVNLDSNGNHIKDFLLRPKESSILKVELVTIQKNIYLVLVTVKTINIFNTKDYKQLCSYNFELTERNGAILVHSIEVINDVVLCVGMQSKLFFFTTTDSNSFQPKEFHQNIELNPVSLIYKLVPYEKNKVALVESTGAVKTWKLSDKNSNWTLKSSIKIHPNTKTVCARIYGNYILMATISGQIQIVDLNSGHLECEIQAHVKCVTAFDVAQETGLLISASEDSYVRIFQLQMVDNKCKVQHLQQIVFPNELICGLRFLNPSGNIFTLSSYESPDVKLFQLKQ